MAKFVIYRDVSGGYRWRLIAANGEKVSWSESYTSKQAAIQSAQWVKVNASSAPLVEN